ncbi:MAG TPA: hypothetical protein VG826_29565 [Pirellulales bacterium]|nr:hypothetical protein [Pirellulales bacterium]
MEERPRIRLGCDYRELYRGFVACAAKDAAHLTADRVPEVLAAARAGLHEVDFGPFVQWLLRQPIHGDVRGAVLACTGAA